MLKGKERKINHDKILTRDPSFECLLFAFRLTQKEIKVINSLYGGNCNIDMALDLISSLLTSFEG